MSRRGKKPQGIPVNRPVCRGCGKPLRPVCFAEVTRVERPKTEAESAAEKRANRGSYVSPNCFHDEYGAVKFSHWDGYDGFHSLRCAQQFALRAYNAGFRVPEAP